MVEEIVCASAPMDPRVRRTRQMLHEALDGLLQAKSIEKISVGDITEAATLNRATFYDHYPDKFALLEGLVASRFEELLSKRGVVFHGGCPAALKRVILATCDYLATLQRGPCPNRRQMETLFESAVIGVVRGTILAGMKEHGNGSVVTPELAAATVSGAIYGAAKEWVQTPERAPVEEIVDSISALISPMLGFGAPV